MSEPWLKTSQVVKEYGIARSTLLTVRDVAKQLKVSPKIVREHIASGRLSAVNVSCGSGRKTWRIAPRDLASFELRRQRFPQVRAARRHEVQSPDVIQFV